MSTSIKKISFLGPERWGQGPWVGLLSAACSKPCTYRTESTGRMLHF